MHNRFLLSSHTEIGFCWLLVMLCSRLNSFQLIKPKRKKNYIVLVYKPTEQIQHSLWLFLNWHSARLLYVHALPWCCLSFLYLQITFLMLFGCKHSCDFFILIVLLPAQFRSAVAQIVRLIVSNARTEKIKYKPKLWQLKFSWPHRDYEKCVRPIKKTKMKYFNCPNKWQVISINASNEI